MAGHTTLLHYRTACLRVSGYSWSGRLD